MKKTNGALCFSPSDLINFMKSDFITWMDRYNLEFPGQLKPDDSDEHLKMLSKKGLDHEKSFLKQLKMHSKITEIIPNDTGYDATLSAMEKGLNIYQANLISINQQDNAKFAGYADFLVKVEGKSALGDWHYEPWDTKLALKSKPHFVIQLCCYAEMLESIQGIRPNHFHIILGNGDKKTFRTEDYFDLYKQIKRSFLQQQKDFNPMQPPEINGLEDYGRWTRHAEKILKQQDHLSRVANIRKTQIKNLYKAGITTLTQLAQTANTHVSGILPNTLTKLKKQATTQLQSETSPIPLYEIIQPQPSDPRKGLALLPPSSINDVWLDMEGYPHVDGGLEYLLGIMHLNGDDNLIYKDWWARDHQQEKESFQSFVNWVYDRWQHDPSLHIYHYATYETAALKRLMGRYGICEEKIDDLLRHDVFVDVCTIVRQGLIIGTPTYSLKDIEKLYLSNSRSAEITKATSSIVYYEQWLENNDGDTFENSKILRSIRDYNKDDIFSLKSLCNWLRLKQAESGIHHISKINRIEEKQKEDAYETKCVSVSFNTPIQQQALSVDQNKNQKHLAEIVIHFDKIPKLNFKILSNRLAQQLLTSLETNKDLAKDQEKLTVILAYLLEFHNREERPNWWSIFDRQAMTEDQLIDDLESLGGLVRTTRPIQSDVSSYTYEYRFDQTQDTKIEKGDRCRYDAFDYNTTVEIVNINNETGLVEIKVSKRKPEPPHRLNLISVDIIPPKIIQESIFSIVTEWQTTGKLPQAIEDFLLRRQPRLQGHDNGAIIKGSKELLDEVKDAILNMQNTTLCIQGPPGSGKTYTAANAIVALIRQGKTVGITSNSHKAIAHLMDEAMKAAEKQEISIPAVKIQSNSEKFYIKNQMVQNRKNATNVFPNKIFKLIGGTAWAFSHKQAHNQLDYLFVDEAGQVPVANLLGMSASTKNIVLMGDQMQLSNPIKGSHPGESGKSCLNYLLEKHQTIPQTLGIFLGTTFRLHPNICKFISNAIYEDRLTHQATTGYRQIILPKQNHNLITKESGILFIPVEHDGNCQSSNEEVAVIENLVKSLLECSFKENKTDQATPSRPITTDDILIIAPYNAQICKIKGKMPQISAGSIDKFQGQEAPVVIISMCSSNANDSTRGLEFILNKNRLNVAISRAKVLAIVVGNPALANTPCNSIKQMELTNLFCKVINEGSCQKEKLNILQPNVFENSKLYSKPNKPRFSRKKIVVGITAITFLGLLVFFYVFYH